MKSGKLFILACLVPAIFCHAQDKESASKPAQPAVPP